MQAHVTDSNKDMHTNGKLLQNETNLEDRVRFHRRGQREEVRETPVLVHISSDCTRLAGSAPFHGEHSRQVLRCSTTISQVALQGFFLHNAVQTSAPHWVKHAST